MPDLSSILRGTANFAGDVGAVLQREVPVLREEMKETEQKRANNTFNRSFMAALLQNDPNAIQEAIKNAEGVDAKLVSEAARAFATLQSQGNLLKQRESEAEATAEDRRQRRALEEDRILNQRDRDIATDLNRQFESNARAGNARTLNEVRQGQLAVAEQTRLDRRADVAAREKRETAAELARKENDASRIAISRYKTELDFPDPRPGKARPDYGDILNEERMKLGLEPQNIGSTVDRSVDFLLTKPEPERAQLLKDMPITADEKARVADILGIGTQEGRSLFGGLNRALGVPGALFSNPNPSGLSSTLRRQ